MPIRYIPLVLKYITRHPVRSGLTLLGIATAMFLFLGIQAMHSGVQRTTGSLASETVLVVYRENRYCPFTSQLPEHYAQRIMDIPGVTGVVPIKIEVNTCRAALDVVTFRGVPPEDFERAMMDDIEIIEGSLADWQRRGDAALIGERLAERRGLRVGDRISLGGITVTVAGVIASEHPQDENVAYTHLEFIQRSAGNVDGIVTQFNVIIEDASMSEAVATQIDDTFRTSEAPTTTTSEQAFAAQAVRDLVEMVKVARWLGWAALIAVFALVANAIALSVQDRVRDHAVLQTVGYSGPLIMKLVITEGVLISLLGGCLGLVLAKGALALGTFSFTVEGMSVSIDASVFTMVLGLILCIIIGLLAGMVPAWRAGRREIAECFRAV